MKIVGTYADSQGKLLFRVYDENNNLLDASGLGDSGKIIGER